MLWNQSTIQQLTYKQGITFQNGKCVGGHGLSVGSVGHGKTADSNTVSNVKFLSSSVINSSNGIRVKSFFDGTGKIDGVTYSGITLSGITGYVAPLHPMDLPRFSIFLHLHTNCV